MKRAIHYVRNPGEIAKEITDPHSIFSVHGNIKSVVTESDIFKSVEGFGDEKTAYECLYLWKQAGFSGSPSSPVAFFRNVCEAKTNMKAGTNFSLSKYFHGGWITNTATGFHHGNCYMYDIIKAYFWAGSLGLPMETRFFRDQPKSPDWIAVVKIISRENTHPDFLQKNETVITSEDAEFYNIEFEFKYGFDCYKFEYRPQDDLDKIKYLPEKCWKLASQSYWGIWAMDTGVNVLRVNNDGEIVEWKLNNRNKKMIWAFYIIHRVTQKVYDQFSDNVLNIYVDSILTKNELIATGENPGDWKLKNTFDGVYIKNSGVWTSIENFLKHGKRYQHWIKHAGYKAEN